MTKNCSFFIRYVVIGLVSGGVYIDTLACPILDLYINFKALFGFISINFSPFLGLKMTIFATRLTRLLEKYLEFFDETKSVEFVRKKLYYIGQTFVFDP